MQLMVEGNTNIEIFSVGRIRSMPFGLGPEKPGDMDRGEG